MFLGFVNETSYLLVVHLLLIARVYIYTCKLKNTTLALTFFTELVINSARTEKWLALDTNTLGWVPTSSFFLFFVLLFFFGFLEGFTNGKMYYLVIIIIIVVVVVIIIIINFFGGFFSFFFCWRRRV